MSKSRLTSGKIKKITGPQLSEDRYEFLDLANAEPDLGLPTINESILVGDTDGTRTWVNITTYTENFKGFTGSQGYTGSQGNIGYTGSAGLDGVGGSDGTPGYTGSLGYTGSSGFTGSQGAGFTGSQGNTGFVGSTGDIGYTGSQGDIGYTGSQGNIGYTGSIGFTGSRGTTGFVGSSGNVGNVGFTGSRGANGNRSVALIQEGLLVVRTGSVRWYAPADLTIQQITFRLDVAANQIATIVINKNGVATRTINIAANQVKAVNTSQFDMTTDEYLTVDVTATGAPGATTQGSGLSVIFLYQFLNL